MSVLSKFLSEKGKEWRDSRAERDAELRDWTDAVKRLIERIKGWVRDADSLGVLEVIDRTVEKNEARLGHYTIPAITIRLGAAWVHVVPVARYTLGKIKVDAGHSEEPAAGCVAVVDSASLDTAYANFRFYRLPRSDRWFLLHSAIGQETPDPDREFTRELFEKIIVDILR